MKVADLRGHERPVNVVKYNIEGDFIISGGMDSKVNIYDTYTYEKIGTMKTESACKTLDILDDSSKIITGSLSGVLEIFSCQNGQMEGHYMYSKYAKLKYIELSYGNKDFLAIYESYGQASSNEITIFNFNNFYETLIKTTDRVTSDTLKPDKIITQNEICSKAIWGYLNKCIISGTENGNLIKYDPQTCDVIIQKKAHLEGEIRSLSFSKDYTILASCGTDGCKLYDPETFDTLRTFKTDVPMNTVVFSPLMCSNDVNSQRFHFLMGGGIPAREAAKQKQGGFEVHVCSIIYEEEVGSISGHFSPINCLVYQPDGLGFATAAEEGNVKVIKFDERYWDFD